MGACFWAVALACAAATCAPHRMCIRGGCSPFEGDLPSGVRMAWPWAGRVASLRASGAGRGQESGWLLESGVLPTLRGCHLCSGIGSPIRGGGSPLGCARGGCLGVGRGPLNGPSEEVMSMWVLASGRLPWPARQPPVPRIGCTSGVAAHLLGVIYPQVCARRRLR